MYRSRTLGGRIACPRGLARNTTNPSAYDSAIAGNPFFWAFLIGFVCGFALNILLRNRIRTIVRVTAALFCATLAISCATLGMFIVGASAIRDIRLLFMIGGTTAVTGVCFRFPKSAGIPLLAIVVICSGMIVVGLQRWIEFDYDRPVFEFTATKTENDVIRLEILGVDRSWIISSDSGEIQLELEILASTNLWFLTSQYARPSMMDEDGDRLSKLMARYVPGWSLKTIISEPLQPRELYRYRATVSYGDVVTFAISPPGR